MNTTKLNIQKTVKEWKSEPSLKNMDISKLSKRERKELSEKLDNLEALALKAKEMLND